MSWQGNTARDYAVKKGGWVLGHTYASYAYMPVMHALWAVMWAGAGLYTPPHL